MLNNLTTGNYELICAIVNCGQGSKIAKRAKDYGITGSTIALGRGTAHHPILEFMGLCDRRKEIVYMAADSVTADLAMAKIHEEFELDKPNHGIAFTVNICAVAGTGSICCRNDQIKGGDGKYMYQLITVIVDKGQGENVIQAAEGAGSTGGTIMNARGAGVHETSKLFAMDVEPEKEVVMILSPIDGTEAIVGAIRIDLKMDEPGNGIIYIQNVNQAFGLKK